MSTAPERAVENRVLNLRNRHELSVDETDEARIGRRIEPQPDGCWIYNGKRDTYVDVYTAGGSVKLHRWVYQTLVGDIDEGCHIHHKCETPGCCNPDHLVQLTPKEHKAAHRRLRSA